MKSEDKKELAIKILRQHIVLYNMRGDCSMMMFGAGNLKISPEEYEGFLELLGIGKELQK